MAMSSDLFLAILSMDAYNRSYGEGLLLPAGSQIGAATVGLAKDDAQAQSASFFAQEYTIDRSGVVGLTTGQKIISYRGTDSATDVATGWFIGIHDYLIPQAEFAAQFFQAVVGNGSTSGLTLDQLNSANILLTGHSMGGGLAGFVSSIYGRQYARGFDPMAFKSAATDLIDAAINGYSDAQGIYVPGYYGDSALKCFSLSTDAVAALDNTPLQ